MPEIDQTTPCNSPQQVDELSPASTVSPDESHPTSSDWLNPLDFDSEQDFALIRNHLARLLAEGILPTLRNLRQTHLLFRNLTHQQLLLSQRFEIRHMELPVQGGQVREVYIVFLKAQVS